MAQTLTTPVVSVATPSLLAPFSSMQTTYNTGESAKTRCGASFVESGGDRGDGGGGVRRRRHEYSLYWLCESFWNDSTSKVSINMD